MFFLVIYFQILNSFALSGMDNNFHPVTTINAHTIPKGTFAMSRAPIGNISTTFLVSSVNYAIGERVEIGTSPLFYAIPKHKHNFMVEYNFWRSQSIDWAMTFGKLVFDNSYDHLGVTRKAEVDMTSLQVALNLHLPDKQWMLGLSNNSACGSVKDEHNKIVEILTYRCVTEIGIDFQWSLENDRWITFGYGRQREAGITPFEMLQTGVGFTYSWRRPGKFISRPSIGLYQVEDNGGFLIVNSTFNEP
jgi:hypothetical protein